MLLALALSCSDAADSGDVAEAFASPIAGPWSGQLRGELQLADGTTATLLAEAAVWLVDAGERTGGSLHFEGNTARGDLELPFEGLVQVSLETPLTAGAQVLGREYTPAEPEADPCRWARVADPEAFRCPFAEGDVWTWDGATRLDHAWTSGEDGVELHLGPAG